MKTIFSLLNPLNYVMINNLFSKFNLSDYCFVHENFNDFINHCKSKSDMFKPVEFRYFDNGIIIQFFNFDEMCSNKIKTIKHIIKNVSPDDMDKAHQMIFYENRNRKLELKWGMCPKYF